MGRITSPIYDGVGSGLDGSIRRFSRVLGLMVWFRLPIIDVVGPEDVLDLVGDLRFGRITDYLVHSTASTNIVVQSVDKLFPRPHWVDVRNQRFFPNKKLGLFDSIINSWGIRVDCVSVATASCLLGTLWAGFLDSRCLFMGKVPTDAPHCVVYLKVSLLVSAFTQSN